jgi:hypothetical protein
MVAALDALGLSYARRCLPRPSPSGRDRRAPAGNGSRPRPAFVRPSRCSRVLAERLSAHAGAKRRRRHIPAARRSAGRGPVRRLLLFRQVHAEQFAADVLQPVPVGIGARQPRGDLGAEHRRRSVTPKACFRTAMSKRPKWKILVFLSVAQQRARFGAFFWPLAICTTSAVPSPGDSCTTQSRSRCGLRPSVSVSMAIASVVACRCLVGQVFPGANGSDCRPCVTPGKSSCLRLLDAIPGRLETPRYGFPDVLHVSGRQRLADQAAVRVLIIHLADRVSIADIIG